MRAKQGGRPGRYWLYWLNSLILLLPVWYLYDAMTPVFPPEWPEQTLGPITAAPTPVNDEPPYWHHGELVKDFSIRLCEGCLSRVRLARLSVSKRPPEPDADVSGILHGHSDMQEVHVPYLQPPEQADLLWLTVQTWSGETYSTSWRID